MKFGRRTKPTPAEKAEIEKAIRLAHKSTTDAIATRDSLVEQRPWVESLSSYLEERRQRNGFGEDFTIAMTPHRKPY
jgi:hypothetical protein